MPYFFSSLLKRRHLVSDHLIDQYAELSADFNPGIKVVGTALRHNVADRIFLFPTPISCKKTVIGKKKRNLPRDVRLTFPASEVID